MQDVPQFDQEQAQDLLNAAVAQRDNAMNGLLQVQSQLAKVERELASLKTEETKQKK